MEPRGAIASHCRQIGDREPGCSGRQGIATVERDGSGPQTPGKGSELGSLLFERCPPRHRAIVQRHLRHPRRASNNTPAAQRRRFRVTTDLSRDGDAGGRALRTDRGQILLSGGFLVRRDIGLWQSIHLCHRVRESLPQGVVGSGPGGLGRGRALGCIPRLLIATWSGRPRLAGRHRVCGRVQRTRGQRRGRRG